MVMILEDCEHLSLRGTVLLLTNALSEQDWKLEYNTLTLIVIISGFSLGNQQYAILHFGHCRRK